MNPLIPTIAISLFIAIQDFQQRRVYWILFPLLFCTGIYFQILRNESSWSLNLLQNGIFLGLILLLILCYFLLRTGSIHSLKKQIGLGDILLFVAILPFFDTVEFALFFSLSLLFILLCFLPIIVKKKNFEIPLAGSQSLLFALVLFLSSLDIFVLDYFKELLL